MNIDNLELNKEYNYKQLCNILGVPSYTGGTQKKAQLKEFARHFSYEKKGEKKGTKYIVTEIFDKPMQKGKYGALDDNMEIVIAEKINNQMCLSKEGAIYFFTIDLLEQNAIVNANYRQNRKIIDRDNLKDRISNNVPFEKFINAIWDKKGDKYMSYAKYLDKQTTLVVDDVFNNILDKRSSEILSDCLSRLEKKYLIQNKICFVIKKRQAILDENGNQKVDENGNALFIYRDEYSNDELTKEILNIQAEVLNKWDVETEGKSKKYQTIGELPSYLLPKLNADTYKIMNEGLEINDWQVYGLYRCHKIIPAEKMLERFIRLSKDVEIKTKSDLNKRNINNLITLTMAKTIYNRYEKSIQGNSAKGNKIFDETIINNYDLYIDMCLENISICDLLEETTLKELENIYK